MNWFRSESNSRNYLRAVSRSLTTGGRWSNSGRYLVISSSYKLVLLFVQSAGMISLHDSVGFRSDYLVFSFFFIYLFFIVMMMMMITEKKEKHFGTVATHYCVFFPIPNWGKEASSRRSECRSGSTVTREPTFLSLSTLRPKHTLRILLFPSFFFCSRGFRWTSFFYPMGSHRLARWRHTFIFFLSSPSI